MEDTIKASEIYNRKLILEIRYDANPLVMDERGRLLNSFLEHNIIAEPKWEFGLAEIKIADNLTPSETRKLIYIDIHRISISSSKNETNESFFHWAEKTYKIFKKSISNFDITRIGCRIQGTYKTKSKEEVKLIENFTKLFPSQFLLEDYHIKDLRFTLTHQNGHYSIGPVTKDDAFLNSEFTFKEKVKNIGFAIDTDNFVIKGKEKKIIEDSFFKLVYDTSISVEKSLFDKLNQL